MNKNGVVNKLLEIHNKENQNEEILDCTKEIEEFAKKVLPEENN